MNVYRLNFKARCPVDGAEIEYAWMLQTGYSVMAEELRRIADGFGTELHERIADALYDRFGGQQTLKAVHAGAVSIETLRPDIAHWQRPVPADPA